MRAGWRWLLVWLTLATTSVARAEAPAVPAWQLVDTQGGFSVFQDPSQPRTTSFEGAAK